MSSSLPDDSKRKRIGPWKEEELPTLKHFEPDRNFVVRASAGSGKTTALIARMVALVRQGVAPGDMAAITFTRKAAGEMRQRFFRELRKTRAYLEEENGSESGREDLTSQEVNDQLERVNQALDETQQCFIGTIHSFCARILREHAVEIGLPPDFVAGLDDRDERELRERVWQKYLEDAWDDNFEAVEHLGNLGVDVGELDGEFGKLCGNPDLEPFVDGPESMPTLESAVAKLKSFVDEYGPYLTDPEPEANAGKVSVALRSARLFLQHRSLDDLKSRADFLELFEGTTEEDTRKSTDTEVRGDMKNKSDHWTDKTVADTLDDQIIPELVETVIEPALAEWRSYGHRRIVEFIEPAVTRYRTRRREEGRLTFLDLLVETRRLLRENPSARENLQSRYPRILVDEFQDTDPIQAEILFYLTGKNTEEKKDWTRCDPRPGSLFIVGDDQQSIYGFRRADMRVFNQVKELLSKPDADNVLQLTSNFRSLGPICDWCDSVFSELFSEGVQEGIQAQHQQFSKTRNVGEETSQIRALEVPDIKRNPAEDIARKNAGQIATFIAEAITSNDPVLREAQTDGDPVAGNAEDFMILTRNKGRLDIFAEELASRDIPYALTGGQDLGNSSELRALVDLMACVQRPDDPVALVAYLRGAIVGLSDDSLFRLKEAGFRYGETGFELQPEVKDDLDNDLAGRVEKSLGHLRSARSHLQEYRPVTAVGKIIDRTGLYGRALDDRVHGSLRAGRLSRLMALIRGLDHKNLHWTEILEELQRLADGETDADGLTLDSGTGGAVRLLNVHQAKGLEAPIVILADPYHKKYPRDPSQYVDREEGTESGKFVLPMYEEGRWRKYFAWGPHAWNEKYKEQAKREKEAEERRLQYVASTRAEDCLIVSRYEGQSEKGFWANLYPNLEERPTVSIASDDPTEEDTDQKSSLPIPDLKKIKKDRDEIASSEASYVTQTVTERAEGTYEPLGSAVGHSPKDPEAFGTAVHDLLEWAVYNRESLPEPSRREAMAQKVLKENYPEFEDEDLKRAVTMLERFRNSSVWSDLRHARAVYPEHPLTWRENGTVVRGTIDLVYATPDSWHIVDYKTDQIGEGSVLGSLEGHKYAGQVRQYTDAWERLTEEEVASTSLWFAETGEIVVVS